jgi:hypothetical protein
METQENNNLLLRDILSSTPFGSKGRESLRRLKTRMTTEEFVRITPTEFLKKLYRIY